MRAIWSEENKLSLWLDIEEFASEALVTQGVVPKKDFLKIREGCQAWKCDTAGLASRQRELEKVLNHDVIAFTTAVTERINDPASRWLHFGLTSSDIVDTAFGGDCKSRQGGFFAAAFQCGLAVENDFGFGIDLDDGQIDFDGLTGSGVAAVNVFGLVVVGVNHVFAGHDAANRHHLLSQWVDDFATVHHDGVV